MRNKKKYLLLLLLLPLLVWSVIWIFEDSSEGKVTEKATQEKKSNKEEIYPRFITNSELPEFEASSVFAVYYDKENEKILYEKNSKEILPIASITKIMTALVAFENYDLKQPVGVKEEEVVKRTEFRDFRAWKDTTIEELLYPLLIESNNSAAFSLAMISDRFLPGEGDSVEEFVKAMNKKAREIGLNSTEFFNPSGLDTTERSNYSTAREVVELSRYIISNTDIFDISVIPSYSLYSPNRLLYYEITNTNDLLFTLPGDNNIIGSKTGRTRRAGECLILITHVPESNGKIFKVVLGSNDRSAEMKKLIDFIFKSYKF